MGSFPLCGNVIPRAVCKEAYARCSPSLRGYAPLLHRCNVCVVPPQTPGHAPTYSWSRWALARVLAVDIAAAASFSRHEGDCSSWLIEPKANSDKEYIPLIDLLYLSVTSAVVSSCGHDSGWQLEPLVAHELAGHWATHAGAAETSIVLQAYYKMSLKLLTGCEFYWRDVTS